MTALLDPPSRLSFSLPKALEASEPPEARGVPRDGVRMLVARRSDLALVHATFSDLPRFLDAGDLVVVNTSGTIPAAFDAVAADGTPVVVHLSTQLDDGSWMLELRRPRGRTTTRWQGPLPDGPLRAVATTDTTTPLVLTAAVVDMRPQLPSERRGGRLVVGRLEVDGPVLAWLEAHGRPIRYGYVDRPWPTSAYQNVYATEPGSAEMPSAGRPFTAEVLLRLVAKGVGVTPLVLHTGVASLEADELPYPERAVVPPVTAARVNAARGEGRRVIAVGTTVVRALESAADECGVVSSFDGWTDLVITPERGVRAVDGLVTGWHEPEASHLLMLEAIAGRELLERSYAASLEHGYLWHEFGDSHLILP